MLKKAVVAALLALSAAAVVPTPAAAEVSVGVSVGVFHERLSPYGQWVVVGRYGSCWRPRHVARTWRPYTVGYWAYGDFGWTWESTEDWGWATYHYGRWYYDPFYGWVWIPGFTWAPGYVAWRYGGDWVGWAPLPPGIDPGYSVNIDAVVAPSSFVFVETRFFGDRSWASHAAPAWRNSSLIATTRNITRYDVQSGHVFNRGVDARVIERASGRPIQRVSTTDVARLGTAAAHPARQSSNVRSTTNPHQDTARVDQRQAAHQLTQARHGSPQLESRSQNERHVQATKGVQPNPRPSQAPSRGPAASSSQASSASRKASTPAAPPKSDVTRETSRRPPAPAPAPEAKRPATKTNNAKSSSEK